LVQINNEANTLWLVRELYRCSHIFMFSESWKLKIQHRGLYRISQCDVKCCKFNSYEYSKKSTAVFTVL